MVSHWASTGGGERIAGSASGSNRPLIKTPCLCPRNCISRGLAFEWYSRARCWNGRWFILCLRYCLHLFTSKAGAAAIDQASHSRSHVSDTQAGGIHYRGTGRGNRPSKAISCTHCVPLPRLELTWPGNGILFTGCPHWSEMSQTLVAPITRTGLREESSAPLAPLCQPRGL